MQGFGELLFGYREPFEKLDGSGSVIDADDND
jgi:hypothetical protein